MRARTILLTNWWVTSFLIGGFAVGLEAFSSKMKLSLLLRDRSRLDEFASRRRAVFGSPTIGEYNSCEDGIKIGDLLGDLPTPTMLIELSLAESAVNQTSYSLDDLLSSPSSAETLKTLNGCIFVHTRVTDTSVRDRINEDHGSGKSPVIGKVDTCPATHVPGGAFLGLGLSNHHVGGYYWARSMGIGASLEAHGVGFREIISKTNVTTTIDEGELYWKKRSGTLSDRNSALCRGDTTGESSNSNDGKRSEWADFLVLGDTVQLVPQDVEKIIRESCFQRLVGVRRTGRPLGADPVVERLWKRRLTNETNTNVHSSISWDPL